MCCRDTLTVVPPVAAPPCPSLTVSEIEKVVVVATGGGVKVNLIGPLRLRVDYRIFKLGSGALHSPAHRFYAGLNLKF